MYAIYVIYIYVIYICNIRNIYMQVSSVIFEFQKSMLIKNNFWDFLDSDQIITFYVTEKCLLISNWKAVNSLYWSVFRPLSNICGESFCTDNISSSLKCFVDSCSIQVYMCVA